MQLKNIEYNRTMYNFLIQCVLNYYMLKIIKLEKKMTIDN